MQLFAGRRVLVCDDSLVALERICDTFEDLGCTIVGKARDGESLIDFYRNNKETIDLVTLDLVLPGMDGLEVLAALKEIDANVCVLILSSIVQPEIEENARKLGASKVLAKTFDVEKLKSAAAEALEGH